MTYSQSEIQTIALRARLCSSVMGYDLLLAQMRGKDCCDTSLKYLLRAQKILSCFIPVGGIANQGVHNQSTIAIIQGETAVTNLDVDSSDDNLKVNLIGPYIDAETALEAFLTLYLANTTYTGSFTVNPNDVLILNIIQPFTYSQGATFTMTFTYDDGSTIVVTGTFSGGQYTVTADDQCISDDQAERIIENILSICQVCSPCQDLTTDAVPYE